jgi:putative peptide zinc metalloprotease protein
MNDLFTSIADRPLALAMRRDLIVRRQKWQGREYWTVKDPLTLKYYRFEDEEFAVLSLLDGQISSRAVCDEFERRFAPQRISAKQLQHLLTMLHRSNLLVANAAGQGGELLKRDNQRRRQKWLELVGNFLCLRFRGIDPDRFLTWLNRHAGWVFSRLAVCVAFALILTAVALVAAEFDSVWLRLPTFRAFFAASNWFWLAVTMCMTKILHELGHGLACKRFGGECHEMGVMLLVLTPCLYCNVSDAWLIPSKWRRAAVGAGGMYIELILASLATLLWFASQPGLFNHLCLNVMFVCSVSTLLFNVNPLMRFDGYYILADLIEIPNLRQKSTAIIERKLGAWLLGLRERPDPFTPARHQWAFAAYSIASAIYTWLVSFSIFWFLYQLLEPYGLKIVGQLLASLTIFSLIGLPIIKLTRFLFRPAAQREVNKMRALMSFSAITAAAVAIAAVPLPYYVAATFEIQPRDAASVYVELPGELKKVYLNDGRVAAGQPIAELADCEALLTLQRLEAQRGDLEARIESIRQRAHTDVDALLELSHTEEALTALQKQINRLNEDLAKLVVRAPASGVIVPATSKPSPERNRFNLASWSGRPLERRNLGAYLESSTLLCRIAEPGCLEAIVAIDQDDLDFVQSGQVVDLFLASQPGQRLSGHLDHIAEQNMEAASTRLSARTGGELATRTDQSGVERPLSVIYQASVPLDDESRRIVIGATGSARIHAGYQPLWQRAWRAACRTFYFKM